MTPEKTESVRLSPATVARVLDVAISTIRVWYGGDRPILRAVGVGGKLVRIPVDELRRFLLAQTPPWEPGMIDVTVQRAIEIQQGEDGEIAR
jgi:hypothetical protein